MSVSLGAAFLSLSLVIACGAGGGPSSSAGAGASASAGAGMGAGLSNASGAGGAGSGGGPGNDSGATGRDEGGAGGRREDSGGAPPSHSPAGTLQLTLDGSRVGIDSALVNVAGKAKLGGAVQLTFAPGFVPTSGQRFTVLHAAQGVSGTFDTVTSSSPVVLSSDVDRVYATVK